MVDRERPDISVVIPAYNRVDLLRACLHSVGCAARLSPGLGVETIVVDDGSDPPLADQLGDRAEIPGIHCQVVRQCNQGSIVARSTGLARSRGEYVLFLDSDDQIGPEKLQAHVDRMRISGADVSYSDTATAEVGTAADLYETLSLSGKTTFPSVDSPAELFLGLQPAPHSPVYRRTFLVGALKDPIVPADRVFDATGDTWLYFNCSLQPGKVVKVDGHYSISVIHSAGRFSSHWERLGVSGLGLMLAFSVRCPRTAETQQAREVLGRAALRSYRRLPRNFDPLFERLTLELWQNSPRRAPLSELGGGKFAFLTRLLGTTNAARLLRWWQSADYEKVRTISGSELEGLMRSMLQHVRALCGGTALAQMYRV